MESSQTVEGIRGEEVQAILNTFAQASGEGFICINAQSIILLASPLLEAMWGYETGELIGKPVQTLMPRRHRPDHTAGVRRAVMEDRQLISGEWGEVDALHKNGTEFSIYIRIMRVQQEGRFLLVAAVRNAEPYHRARLALEEALKLTSRNIGTEALSPHLHQTLEAIEQFDPTRTTGG